MTDEILYDVHTFVSQPNTWPTLHPLQVQVAFDLFMEHKKARTAGSLRIHTIS